MADYGMLFQQSSYINCFLKNGRFESRNGGRSADNKEICAGTNKDVLFLK